MHLPIGPGRTAALGATLGLALCLLSAPRPAWTQPAGAPEAPVVFGPEGVVPAPAGLREAFPRGLPPSLGQGLTCSQAMTDGSVIFLASTGRGPEAPGPMVGQGKGAAPWPSAVFAAPAFAPKLVTLRLAGGAATVLSMTPLKNASGKPLTGLPPGPRRPGEPAEVPLDISLSRLPHDPQGVSPHGVALDAGRGCLWISDDYGPSYLRVSPADGTILERYHPGRDLPELLGEHWTNRGFNGIAVTPKGKICSMMRSPLVVEGRPGFFTRLVEFDPQTQLVRQFAYPLDTADYGNFAEAETCGPVSLTDNKFLVLEQGADRTGQWRARVYFADISTAININKVRTGDGKALEVLGPEELGKGGVLTARKLLALDLVTAGLPPGERADSLTLMPDGRTVAVTTGTDELESVVLGPAADARGRPVLAPPGYVLDGQVLTFQGELTGARIGLQPSAATPVIRLFTLPKKVSELAVK